MTKTVIGPIVGFAVFGFRPCSIPYGYNRSNLTSNMYAATSPASAVRWPGTSEQLLFVSVSPQMFLTFITINCPSRPGGLTGVT